MFNNQNILIIGGTGTVGEMLVKRLLKSNPKVIRIFSRDEYKQFVMEKDFYQYKDKLRFLIGDVRDYERLCRAMEGIDFVFDLAAMKHVPACEYNPFEAVKTNVLGAQNVINAAMENEVGVVVYTSSDKAISPTNVMGATKLVAERLFSSAHYSKGSKKTIFTSVRFGNVIGSRGSVIPLFKRQILNEGRITLTNKEMTRFMMTLSKAVELTIKAATIASGGEVFVLKMPVISLSDLANIVIEEVCERNHLDKSNVRIEEIGLRPGEKMYEELMTEEEANNAYEFEDMYAIVPYDFDDSSEHTKNHYKDATIAKRKASYSSSSVSVLDRESVREMLIAEGVL